MTELDERPEATVGADQAPLVNHRHGRWLVFGIATCAMSMSSIDQTIVATALPSIQRELHAQINWSGWTITIYALAQVVIMPFAGKISDQFGRKTVFLAASILFTTASLCCGLADNIYVLVALRAAQGMGGGAFLPSASGIVSDQFGEDRDRALGMFTSIVPIGGIVGPILGGVFVTVWSWRGIFLVNVPIGIVLVAMIIRFIPRSETKAGSKLDVRGVLLLRGLILSSMFGISYLGTGNAQLYSPLFLGPEAIAVIAGVLFVRHARDAVAPFVPIGRLYAAAFGSMNLINFLYGSAALGFGAVVPLYAENRYHIHSLEAGTLLTARAVGMIAIAGVAVLALRKTGYRLPMIAGFIVVAMGLAMMWFSPRGLSPYLWLAIAAAITGLGMGFSVPAANNASMQLAPTQVAAISGLRGMFRQSGAIFAVSITTAILARAQDPGLAQAWVFLCFGGVVLSTVPMIFLVPDHHGSW